jgi:hypothetical protein
MIYGIHEFHVIINEQGLIYEHVLVDCDSCGASVHSFRYFSVSLDVIYRIFEDMNEFVKCRSSGTVIV